MNEEELQRDILFQIDMQLYDKYNDKIAVMNDHLGDIYTYRDIEDVEKAEREEKIDLLTKAIKELQKEIERLKNFNKTTYIRKDTIRKKLEEIENSDTISIIEILDFLKEISGE